MLLPARLRLVAALAAATAGAFLFRAAGMPLAYILGALVGAAVAANLLGPPPGGRFLRRGGQLIVGASVGAVLEPDVIAALGELLPLMVLVALLANAAGLLIAIPVARIAGTTKLTAILSCLPAGMAEMSLLAGDLKADEHVVAIIHTLRVILILLFIPFWFHVTKTAAGTPPPSDWVGLAEIAAVLVVAGALAASASRLGVLNPWVIAPMLVCLAVVAAGYQVPALPQPVLVAAQIAIGASLGARFSLGNFGRLPRAALAGIVSALFLIGVGFFGLAALISRAGGVEAVPATLAAMPGGLGEMIASAAALGFLPATVAGFQIVRSILTNFCVPPLIRLFVTRRP